MAGRTAAEKREVYLADMSRCRPASALTRDRKVETWQVLDYETTSGNTPRRGRMVYAPSYAGAPQVTLPLGVSGWHHIFVGFWNPHFAHDGGMTVKVKLDADPCFTRISEPEPLIDAAGTCLREAFFRTADLTGESLRFGQIHGPFAQKAAIAYVRLVPLSAGDVAALRSDRERADTRIVAATNDGISYFHRDEYRKKEHLLEMLEPYRHSDVGRVIWAVNYGDTTNYPSRTGAWIAGPEAPPIGKASQANHYVKGVKAGLDGLRAFAAKGVLPQNVVERHVHAMGLKFDAMFRLAILGNVPPTTFHPGRFIQSHPECRQVTREGVAVEKASYAFPAVRSCMLAIVRETAERFNIDGAVLGFNRGPEFMLYEEPVLADYGREYRKRHAASAQAPASRRLICAALAATPPRLDGRLDDACWRGAQELGDFRRRGGDLPRNPTSVMAAFDRENLYLAVRCDVRDLARLKKDCPPGEKSSKVWQDDCVDLKLSADGGRSSCQFIVSASGASWARRLGEEKGALGWSAAADIGDKGYTVEMAIPLRSLGIASLKPGTPILFNIGREDRAGGVQESVLAEPYLELFQAPLIVLGTQAEFHAVPVARKLAQIDRADGRNVPFTDPVMQAVRCGYLTEFVRDARAALDEAGARKGRRLELGVWVYGSVAANLRHGFDVETWIEEGLIDSVIGFMSPDPADDHELIRVARKRGCRYLAGFIPWMDKHSAQATVKKAATAYASGVDGLAVWDMNGSQDYLAWWPIGRMLGHPERIKEWSETCPPPMRSARLKRIAGCDVADGLYAAVYSGG